MNFLKEDTIKHKIMYFINTRKFKWLLKSEFLFLSKTNSKLNAYMSTDVEIKVLEFLSNYCKSYNLTFYTLRIAYNVWVNIYFVFCF